MSSRSLAQALRAEACQIGGQFTCPLPFAPNRQFCRVKRMSRQQQFLLKLRCPSFVDEVEIELFIRSVNLVSHHGMTKRGQVHPDLVRSSRVGYGTQEAELIPSRGRPNKSPLHLEAGQCWSAAGSNHLFKPDAGRLVFALSIQRSINDFAVPFRPAPNDGQIFFEQLPPLHQKPESTRCGGLLRHQNKAARLAVESVHD